MRGIAGALLVLGVAASTFAGAQGQIQPPVFRARTDLVRLDVVVVDADGHVVRGLTKEDFRVVDRGRVRELAAFEEIAHAPVAAGGLPMSVRREVADNSAQSDRLIVLALDDLHFQAKTDDVKRMARRLVEAIGSGAALALVTTSGTFGVEPTTDRALLLAEIDAFLDRFDPEGRRLARGAVMPAPPQIRNALGEPVAIRGPSDPASFFGDLGTFKSIEGVAKKIGADAAGRRSALVWISGGMNAVSAARCDADEGSAWHCGALAGLLQNLGKSNVTAYAIATGDFNSTLLKDVANASGGFAIAAGTFDRDMPRLVEDLDHYYLLGFYPDAGDRGYRTLEVKTSRPDLTVRHRRGYDPETGAAKPRNASPLARLSESALPNGALALRMFAAPLHAEGKREARTMIALEARIPAAMLAEPDGRLRDTLRYEVWAVDLRRKKVAGSVAREARLAVDPALTTDPRDGATYQVQTSLSLAPGRYQLRASAISAKAGNGGSVYLEVEVPDYRSPAIHIGPIVLRYADGSAIPVVVRTVLRAEPPLAVTLDRDFPAGERLRVQCAVIQRAKKNANVTMDVLTAAGDRARRLLDKQLDVKDPRMLDVRLDLAGLGPGGYRLRVRADDGATAAEREIGFVVR